MNLGSDTFGWTEMGFEKLRQIIKSRRKDIQIQSEKMKEMKYLVSFWNMKQELGRIIYTDQYSLNETIGLERFSLGTWKLEVKEEVQKKKDEEESPFHLVL